MRKSNTRQHLFSRRAILFSGLQWLGLTALAGRLYYLQFIKSAEYKTLAEGNRIKLLLTPPPRGILSDRNGLPIARNKKNFRVLVEDAPRAELELTLRKLAGLLALEKNATEAILAQSKSQLLAPPLLVKEYLSWEELTRIEFHTPDLPGVIIDTGQVRHYSLMEKAAHLVGYVGIVSEKDLDDRALLRLPDFKVGKSGAEKMLESELRGVAGIRQIEVNVHGQPVRELATQDSIAGKNVRLTIDSRLQEFAAQRLEKESGAIVVLDVRNGDVLSLVSMPGFDPNIFSMGIPHDYWKELNSNAKNPLLNKAISGQYPPGSTFKMAVGLAGLEKGIITPESRVSCPGHFFLGAHRFNCWKQEGHGSVNLESAIAESCDTFFYTVAQRLGMDPIADMARRFGLGATLNFGILGEKPGLIPDKGWKMKRYKQPWQGGDTINAGIGQGYVLATPLQLAVMAARIANGGYAVMPRLIAPLDDTEEVPPPSMELTPAMIEAVQQGMNAVANAPNGTAYGKRINDPRYAMAGKTGTSQVRRILVRGRDQSELPWEERHHALFIGYAPVESPRYACCVLVEHGGGGAAAAAPVARDVLLKVQQLADEPVTEEQRAAAFQL